MTLPNSIVHALIKASYDLAAERNITIDEAVAIIQKQFREALRAPSDPPVYHPHTTNEGTPAQD